MREWERNTYNIVLLIYIYIYISAGQRLTVINRIQNKKLLGT